MNIRQTESDRIPAKFASGELAGQYNPADIRGSYSFADVERAFEIPAEVIATAFGFASAEAPGDIQAKDLEEAYGEIDEQEIGTDSLRLFVALWKGILYEPEETTALPYQALSALREAEKIDEEQFAALRSSVGVRAAPAAAVAAEDHVEDPEDTQIRGRTTFNDLLTWGLTEAQIAEAIGTDMGPRASTVRDYLAEQGVEFGTARETLQELLDGE